MHRHLITIEIGIKSRADQGVNLNRLALDQQRLKSLNAQTMQGRRAIQEHRALADDFLEHFPDFRSFTLDNALGALDIAGVVVGNQPADDEGAIQLQRHRFGQAALMQLELGTDDDH